MDAFETQLKEVCDTRSIQYDLPFTGIYQIEPASHPPRFAMTPQSGMFLSPDGAASATSASPAHNFDGNAGGRPSVKHLTCHYWYRDGNCKWDESQCLYSHHYTGTLAELPRQVQAGMPPVAGRNAQTSTPAYHNWRGISPGTGATNPGVLQWPSHQAGRHVAHSAATYQEDYQGRIERLEEIIRKQRAAIETQSSALKMGYNALTKNEKTLRKEGIALVGLARTLLREKLLGSSNKAELLRSIESVASIADDEKETAKELRRLCNAVEEILAEFEMGEIIEG